ncbi:MAG: glycosyltransferase family 2 protein [Thermoanaerobaculia bacterium]
MPTNPEATGAPAAPFRLLVAVEGPSDWAWLQAFDFAKHEIDAVFLPLRQNLLGSAAGGRVLPAVPPEGSARPDLPNFGGLLAAMEREKPLACLTLTGGIASRLVCLAADAVGLPIFTLLTTEEELANASRREKGRPDLFFLADARLLPSALEDRRYGSTLLPTGHPARDLAVRGLPGGNTPHSDPAFGDGGAAPRILEILGCWRRDELDPETPDLTVIVPAFREAENLPLVCERLLSTFESERIATEILLVDDASPDRTYAVAVEQMWRSPRIRALTKPTPRGMGNAIRFGLARARAPIIAITMGDGSDDVGRLPAMFRKVRDEDYSLAIGGRYRRPENYAAVPRLYRFWSRCFRIVARLLIGVKLQDYTNSFRVYHRNIFERYGPESGGFEISPESTFKAWFATRRVTEVDVRHLKRAAGQSTFSFLRAGPGYGKILIKAFVNRLTGRWFTLDW